MKNCKKKAKRIWAVLLTVLVITGLVPTAAFAADPTINIPVALTWEDNNNQDGKRPTSVNIRLLADGVQVATKSVTEADGWAWSFTNLAKNKAGTAINYTVTEDAIPDYQPAVTGYDITNKYMPGKTSISVTKAWDDRNDLDGIRPSDVIVKLFADGENTKKTVTLNEGNKWTASFTDLDENRDGIKIVYTIMEEPVARYTSATTGDVTTGFIITNTHIPDTVTVEGQKTWYDNSNQDGIRPAAITVHLLADGVEVDKKSVTEADGWAWSFTDLKKHNRDKLIIYTVTEDAVPGYQTVVTGYNIANTHIPGQTSVSVTKAWNDRNNQDGIRPSDVIVKLFADGKYTEKFVTLNEGNKWTASFANLPKYRDGIEVVYTIEEEPITGYTSVTTGDVTAGFTITNTHIPVTVEVTGSKTWEDRNNQDGKRPTAITINLLADGVKVDEKSVTEADGWAWSFTDLKKYNRDKLIIYTVTEEAVPDYQTTITGYDITNSYTPGKIGINVLKSWKDNENQDGIRPNSVTVKLFADGENTKQTVTLNEGNKWTASFTDLPEYRNGKKIVYTVKEEAVAGYTSVTTGDVTAGFTITNAHTPEKIDITGSKTWDDRNNQDGIRPNSVTVKLFADGKYTEKSVILNEENKWTASFADLPEYRDGIKIVYTVKEEAVIGYTSVTTGDVTAGFTITNTHITETVAVTGSKTWEDNNNQDGKRPASITINLLANGKIVDSKVVSKENNWKWSFTNLPKNEFGKVISYTVTEESVPGYQTVVDGYNITNSYTPGKISINVVKSWKDNSNQDKIRPDSVSVKLFADGKDTKQEVKLTVTNNWAASFADLAEYKDGTKIVYTLTETEVKGYKATITGDGKGNFIITNTHNPSKPVTPIKPNTPSTTNGNSNSPKTGDTTHSAGVMMLFVSSGFGIAAVLITRKKKATNKR